MTGKEEGWRQVVAVLIPIYFHNISKFLFERGLSLCLAPSLITPHFFLQTIAPTIIAASIAGAAVSTVITPFEVIKCRMQVLA